MADRWIMVGQCDDSQNYIAQTIVSDSKLTTLYRAVSKWIIRGGASQMLAEYWKYIDQQDNLIEDALLDQLTTQADNKPEKPQTTAVRSTSYSLDMTVWSDHSSETIKKFHISFTGWVLLHGLKSKLRLDDTNIFVTLYKASNLENIVVATVDKTPFDSQSRVTKRASIVKP